MLAVEYPNSFPRNCISSLLKNAFLTNHLYNMVAKQIRNLKIIQKGENLSRYRENLSPKIL